MIQLLVNNCACAVAAAFILAASYFLFFVATVASVSFNINQPFVYKGLHRLIRDWWCALSLLVDAITAFILQDFFFHFPF